MKNPEFTKFAAFAFCLLLIAGGFWMLPNQEDVKSRAQNLVIAGFLKEFHHAERRDEGHKLINVGLQSREGRQVELASITEGHVTLVNFWATWCAPCLEELPSLARLQEAVPEVMIMPISLDLQKTHAELEEYFEKDELQDLRWFYDHTGELRKKLSLPVYPSTYILNSKSEIIYILQGPVDWSSSKAVDFMKILSNNY